MIVFEAPSVYHARHFPCLPAFLCTLTAWISLSVANASPNYKCVHPVPWWTGWMSDKPNKTDPRRGFISSVWWGGNAKGLRTSSRDRETPTVRPPSPPAGQWRFDVTVMKLWALLCLLFGLLCVWWLRHSPRKATRSQPHWYLGQRHVAVTLKEIYRPRGKNSLLFPQLVEFSIMCHLRIDFVSLKVP